jgi:hypothetical protein
MADFVTQPDDGRFGMLVHRTEAFRRNVQCERKNSSWLAVGTAGCRNRIIFPIRFPLAHFGIQFCSVPNQYFSCLPALRRWESILGCAAIGSANRHVQIRHSQPIRHALLKIRQDVTVGVRRHHKGEARAIVLEELDYEASMRVGADDLNSCVVDRHHGRDPSALLSHQQVRTGRSGSRQELRRCLHVAGHRMAAPPHTTPLSSATGGGDRK